MAEKNVASSNDPGSSPDNHASVPVTKDRANDPALEASDNSTTSRAWNFVALLDIPNDADHDDVGSSFREAGMESQGVHVFQISSHPPTSTAVRTCATASVRPITVHPSEVLNVSPNVEIHSGSTNTPPVILFSEECTACFNISQHFLSQEMVQNMSRQAGKLQLQITASGGNPARIEVRGSCNQIRKFREFLSSSCVQRLLHSAELSIVLPTCEPMLSHSSMPLEDMANSSPSAAPNNIYKDLNSDVLLLMSKVTVIHGLIYYPNEGCVEVTATDPEEREKVVSKFQESYQHIAGSNNQFKVDTIELPPTFNPEEIPRVLETFNQRYQQCYFCYMETCRSIKIISKSSRQFEQSQKLLKDEISGIKTVLGDNTVLVLPGGRTVTVKKGDMIEESADVIVNAANDQLQHWGGLARALDVASNGELQKHCDVYLRTHGPIPTGEVTVTAAGGKLKCKKVIHAVGPIASEWVSNAQCQKLIFDAITNSLKLANKLKAVSIVLPALSTGVYAVKPDISAQAMFNAITSFTYRKPECLKDIRIVILDKPTYACFVNELPRWRSNTKSTTTTPPGFERSLSDQGTPRSNGEGNSLAARFNPGASSDERVAPNQPSAVTIDFVNPDIKNPLDDNPTTKPPPSSGASGGNSSDSVTLKPSLLDSKSPLPSKFNPSPALRADGNGPDNLDNICPICRDDLASDRETLKCCKQTFCRKCLNEALKHSPYCPMCKIPLRAPKGNQPEGTMSYTVSRQKYDYLPGYHNCGRITIKYNFPGGTQTKEHPNPGRHYSGTYRTAYLPDNQEGQHVLHLLRKAFDARLLFTVGTSVTSGAKDTVVWNDVHHKTNTHGGPSSYGYPDPTYLTRVKDELKAKGIS